MAKREKEGEMNEGAEGGWVESGMNEQRYSETPSRGLIQRCSHIPCEQPCSELGTGAIAAGSPGAALSPGSPCQSCLSPSPGAAPHPWSWNWSGLVAARPRQPRPGWDRQGDFGIQQPRAPLVTFVPGFVQHKTLRWCQRMHPSLRAGLIPWDSPVGVLLLRAHPGGCAQGWQPLHTPASPWARRQACRARCSNATTSPSGSGVAEVAKGFAPRPCPNLSMALGCLCGHPEWAGEPWP